MELFQGQEAIRAVVLDTFQPSGGESGLRTPHPGGCVPSATLLVIPPRFALPIETNRLRSRAEGRSHRRPIAPDDRVGASGSNSGLPNTAGNRSSRNRNTCARTPIV